MTGPPPHDPPLSRRAARALRAEAITHARRTVQAPADEPTEPLLDGPRRHEPARHARASIVAAAGVALGAVIAATVVVGSSAAVTAAMLTPPATKVADGDPTSDATAAVRALVPPAVAPSGAAKNTATTESAAAEPAVIDVCADTEVTAALAAGDDTGAIIAAGGAEAFRSAVAGGLAPCIELDDATRVWVVIDKLRPYRSIDYRPADLALPDGVRTFEGGMMRTDAAASLSAMVAAARAAGAGDIAVTSAFRSFQTQQSTYAGHVDSKGVEHADEISARPGFSEHQSGFAADLLACASSCTSMEGFAATPQGEWVKAHSWEYGWIVRYVDGATPVTGYLSEPWHVRYIGTDLAVAYHLGGWQSLEDFFGLPPAPDYAD